MAEPYVLTFKQPTKRVPSENEARRAAFGSRGRAQGFHSDLAAWRQASHAAWKEQRFGPVGKVLGQPCEVTVQLGFYEHRARDPHNYVGTVVKSIVDGLVIADVWPDDTPEWVKVNEPVLKVHPRTSKDERLPCFVFFTLREVN